MRLKAKAVKKRIMDLEGFNVELLDSEIGKPFKSDKLVGFNFDYKRAAPSNWTVSRWSKTRIPEGAEVVVYNQNGQPVHGRTTLSTVRQSYNG